MDLWVSQTLFLLKMQDCDIQSRKLALSVKLKDQRKIIKISTSAFLWELMEKNKMSATRTSLHIPFGSSHTDNPPEGLGKLPRTRECQGSSQHSCCEYELWNQAKLCLILGLTLTGHRKCYKGLENASVLSPVK